MSFAHGSYTMGDWEAAVDAASPASWVLLSASWARVEPARGTYDRAELQRYRQAVQRARKKGVEPVVCLHNGALPDWQIARGGWLDNDSPAMWGCYVDTVARELGEMLSWWMVFWSPLTEAAWYGEPRATHRVARTLLDAHAGAYLTLHRGPGFGGRPAQVGLIEGWGTWKPANNLNPRHHADVSMRERLGPDALLKVLATGRLAPPFSVFGELPNGTPALDVLGVQWLGTVPLPAGTPEPGDPDGCARTLQRVWSHGRPILALDAPESAVQAADSAGVRVLASLGST